MSETTSPAAAANNTSWRHKKRGTTYTVIARASLQDAGGLAREGCELVVYRGEDGAVWARPAAEFLDGRFERIGVVVYSPIHNAWFKAPGEGIVKDVAHAHHYSRAEADALVDVANRADVNLIIQEVPVA